MLLVGIETGLRISDILKLRVRDVAPEMAVIEQKTSKTKRPARRLVLRPELVEALRSYSEIMRLNPDDFLVYSRENAKGKHLSRVQAYRVMASIASELSLSSIGTHSMRKTYARNKYALKNDLRALQDDFNHRDEITTLSYLVSKEKIKELIESDQRL
jgi:integrase